MSAHDKQETKPNMRLTVEELKKLYQQRTIRSAQRSADCLTEETMLRAARGELSRHEREQVADHLVACSDCVQEYRLTSSSKSWADQVVSIGHFAQEKVKGKRGWTDRLQTVLGRLMWEPRWRAVAVATVAIVAIAGAGLFRQMLQPLKEFDLNERGPVSTPANIDPPDRATLVKAPERLAWAAMQSAENYRVALYDQDSTVMWESAPMTGTSVEIPEPVRERLRNGEPYYWRINAQIGIELRQSKLFRFLISP